MESNKTRDNALKAVELLVEIRDLDKQQLLQLESDPPHLVELREIRKLLENQSAQPSRPLRKLWTWILYGKQGKGGGTWA